MNAARQSVVVKAPIDEVYEQWSRVEDLPKFITPLRNVQRIDDAAFLIPGIPTAANNKASFTSCFEFPVAE